MMLGLDNSTAEGSPLDHTMCKLTLFAPYWIDNRTGTDLIFHDKLSAPGRAMLLGGHFPWDHGVVRAPGEGPGIVLTAVLPTGHRGSINILTGIWCCQNQPEGPPCLAGASAARVRAAQLAHKA